MQIEFGLLQIEGRDTRKGKVFHHLTKLFHPMSRASEDVFEFDRWFVSRQGGDPTSQQASVEGSVLCDNRYSR